VKMAKRIFILGKAGPDTYALERHVQEALKIAGIKRCMVRIVEDEQVIFKYGVGLFPTLVIDETVRAIGRVPVTGELLNILRLLGSYDPRDKSHEGWHQLLD
jgi:hypothetical protein